MIKNRKGNADNEFIAAIIIIIVLGFVFWVGLSVGRSVGTINATKKIQIEAVERGFAEWGINKDGSTFFKWNE